MTTPSTTTPDPKRRGFLKGVGLTAAAGAVASPAVAQAMPEVRWRLTSSFPRQLDTIFGTAQTFAKYLAEATDNKFQIQTFPAGELVGGLQAMDAVQSGAIECCQTPVYFYIGKEPAFGIGTGLPFSLNARQQHSWWHFGGGKEIFESIFARFNCVGHVIGQSGCQMGGFFRKELQTVDDLRGLKFRIGGLGGQVLAKLGVIPQQIAAGDVYPALERGTIDAAEWVGPYDDEKLGFPKVAKYYYLPGVLELEANTCLFIGKPAWAALPPNYQAMLRYACAYALIEMLASYDAKNAKAVARVVAAGAQLTVLPNEILRALKAAAETVLDEEAAKSEQFKRVLDNWRAFRAEQHRWFSIADARAEMAVYTVPQ
ncbi:MAG: TRAP transporter substrate-binding protein [Microvirga sp.]